uniref:Limb development membrane protein 1 like n=1 Tax=Anabas testudineus TaxID=64144 RepID=A0A7N6FDS3_ANATE
METDDVSVREQLFHNRVRETIICVLLFTCLYMVSYLILTHFKKTAEFITDDVEDATVNKIALWMCTFTLSVAVCAVLLLPISILSNEVLLTFPQSYYMQWLNGSLIHGLWNLVFLFSNLSLVFLMPFAYFFTESEGFAGSKKGVMARVYEAVVLLLLLALLVLGIVWVASALLHDNIARKSLYDLWEYYLPYLYSGISLFGVLLFLLCTPFGLSRMFSVTGSLLVNLYMSFTSVNIKFFSCVVLKINYSYLMVSSVVGFYSSPLFMGLLPRAQDTNLTEIIANCVSLLILSSALPVFSRTLGITRFDLLGDFGRYNWLGNFYIVFLYNMLFAGLTSASLIKTVTWAVQRELIRAFGLHRLPLTVSRSTVPFRLLLASGLSKIQ